MHTGFAYASYSFQKWTASNTRGLERAILIVMVLSGLIWVISLGTMYNIFVQYSKTAIKATWVITKTTTGAFTNTTAPDAQLITANNAMHKWTANLQKTLIFTLGIMGMTFQMACMYLIWQKIKEYKKIFGDKSEEKNAKNQDASELAAVKRYGS